VILFHDINEARDRILQILRANPLGTVIRVSDEWRERFTKCTSRSGKSLETFEGKTERATLNKKCIEATRVYRPLYFSPFLSHE
jgi:hypothetical protein